MNPRLCLLLAMAVILCGPCFADETINISGIIEYSASGNLFIFLVDEKNSKTPFAGIKTIKEEVKNNDGSIQRFDFVFVGIEPGTYAVRAFLDEDRNGKLNRGITGPLEPWGMSWQDGVNRNWPQWRHYCFKAEKNIDGLIIRLED